MMNALQLSWLENVFLCDTKYQTGARELILGGWMVYLTIPPSRTAASPLAFP